MTLKYESEILFDLMKRDGDDTPSDVLPYESELKEKYLEQVEGAYPKLQDYRSEWLNYNLNAHLPAEFPVETLTNVTEATVDNVVPYAFRSAILTGQTLVNTLKTTSLVTSHETYLISILFFEYVLPSGDYIILLPHHINQEVRVDINLIGGGWVKSFSNKSESSKSYIKFTLEDGQRVSQIYGSRADGYTVDNSKALTNIMVLKYQDGMENWDIPYFEGMTSVKMPVLMTTGKNLFNYFDVLAGKIIWGTSNNVNIFEDSWYQESADGVGFRLRKCIKVKPNTKYYANFPHGMHVMQYKANGDLIKGNYSTISTGYMTTSSETHYINLYPYGGIIEWNEARRQEYQNCYISESEVMSSYEPFKSNILSTSEDVELRGIGDVQDTLNCLTGEVTQNVNEIVLNGSENWGEYNTNSVNTYCGVIRNAVITDYKGTVYLNNKLNKLDDSDIDIEGIRINSSKRIFVRLNRDKGITDLTTFKQYLSQNPITVQYQLETEVIKTVDLTVTDQDGNTVSIIRPIEGTMHVSTSSQTLPPLLDMSVPVEATSQNLMSFANIVEEEK